MKKALKTLSILAAMCAVASVVFVVVLGIQTDKQIEELLSAPGVIDKLDGAKATEETADKVSPLLKHATAFALRINPPPPPPPKRPRAPAKTRVARETKPDRPKPKAPVKAKFKLLATCRYEQQPARSLALLDMPVKGIKWYRQGDDVGHLMIQEVKDGSVICSDGQELFVPVSKKKTKNLLKSEVVAYARPQATFSSTLEAEESIISEEKPEPAGQPVGISTTKPEDNPKRRRRVRRLPPRKPRKQPVVEPTPEERKETLTESIATIKEMMDQPDESEGNEEKAREIKVWKELLQSLEKEREEIEESKK